MDGLPERFPVWQTAMDSFDYCWQRRRLVERYGLIPLVLGVAITWILLFAGVSQSEPSAALFAVLGIQVIILLPPSVAWYRTVVYGESAAWRPMFTFTHLEFRLLIWQIIAVVLLVVALGLAVLVVAGIGAGLRSGLGDAAAIAVVVPLGIAALVIFIWAATRVSMVYALAALDTPVSLRIAWDLTRTVAWRMTGSFIVVTLGVVLFGAVAELIAWIAGTSIAAARGSDIADVMPFVRAAAQAPTSLLWLFATATLFGLVYKTRAQTRSAPMDSPAPNQPL